MIHFFSTHLWKDCTGTSDDIKFLNDEFHDFSFQILYKFHFKEKWLTLTICRIFSQEWEYSSVVENLPSLCEVLG